MLLNWYRDDPDPGIHGAIDWLLRHDREGPEPRRLAWGQAKRLQQMDAELRDQAPLKSDTPRQWYVSKGGHTFVVVRDPEMFEMGSPLDEPTRQDNERLHHCKISRSFALAAKPITVGEYAQFLAERPHVAKPSTTDYSPEAECPMIRVSWFAAAEFCNWLSEKEGIPRDQWCYPTDEKIESGMKPIPNYLQRTGYRLPTEAEMEYTCRVGAGSSRYYGSSRELLGRYAWYVMNSAERTWPVGQKRPNDLGLFEMHGGVWNWTGNRLIEYPNGTQQNPALDREDNQPVKNDDSRVLRGGSFIVLPRNVRSAFRMYNRPDYQFFNIGFRVARTIEK